MNILVTGGAGFIGSHVSKTLLSRGDSVVIIDDFNDRYDPRLKEARVTHMFTDSPGQPVLVRGDITNQELLEQTIQEHSVESIILNRSNLQRCV